MFRNNRISEDREEALEVVWYRVKFRMACGCQVIRSPIFFFCI